MRLGNGEWHMGLEQLLVKCWVNLSLSQHVHQSRKDLSTPRVVCDDISMAASCACEKCRATRSCLISHTSVATSLPLAAGALDAMPFLKVMKKFTKISYARLSPLAKGRIIGMREKGAKHSLLRPMVIVCPAMRRTVIFWKWWSPFLKFFWKTR